MMNFIKKFFGKEKEIKKFSLTTTPATEGSNAKRDLDPVIGELIDRLKQGEQINNSELNQLANFYFGVGEIPNLYYRINPSFQEGMTFEIQGVDTYTNEVNDIVNIHLTMKEIVYNVDLTMRISVKDFHEFLSPINQET